MLWRYSLLIVLIYSIPSSALVSLSPTRILFTRELSPLKNCPYPIRLYSQRRDDFDEAFDEILDTRDDSPYLPSRAEKPPSPPKKRQYLANSPLAGINKWEVVNRALVAGVFVAGIGAGITIDSAINTNPRDLASRDAIDRNAPNPKLCSTFGSSAMVLDTRVFVTFNPFNVLYSLT